MASMNLTHGIKNFKPLTSMKDIKVPEALRHKKLTGIPWFDDALGGEGFTPSTSMMLTGGPGCGKTTMILQLAEAITKAGHVCLMNTGEESLYQVRMVTERLGHTGDYIVGQDIMTDDILNLMEMIRKANKSKQIFLLQDSLQTLNDGKYKDGGTTGNTPVRCCEQLTNWAKDTNGIVMFIGQVNKDGEFAGKNTLKHMVDVHGHLYFDDEKKSDTYGKRLYEVRKNRFGCNGKTYIIGLDKTGLHEEGHYEKANR